MSLSTAPKSLNLISPREAGDLLGLPSRMIYHYLRRCPDIAMERVGRRQLGIRLEDLPRIREVVQESRHRLEMQARSLSADGRWLLVGGAAQRLGISRRSLYRRTQAGEIKGQRAAGPDGRVSWRWDPADLTSPPPAKKIGRPTKKGG